MLYGLVLIGGKSTRMGTDKSFLNYHGIPQVAHMVTLLKQICDCVFVSINSQQKEVDFVNFNVIKDDDTYLGPFNGLMSAHNQFPNASWLIMACDLPLITLGELENLNKNRNKLKLVTAFFNTTTNIPEPLVAIWEKEAFEQAVSFFEKGKGVSPLKFLQSIDYQPVHPINATSLLNANTMEDYERIKKQIQELSK